MELMKLTQTIKIQEEALLEISKNHETAVQRRNFLYVPTLELTPCCQKTSRGSKLHFSNNVCVCHPQWHSAPRARGGVVELL